MPALRPHHHLHEHSVPAPPKDQADDLDIPDLYITNHLAPSTKSSPDSVSSFVSMTSNPRSPLDVDSEQRTDASRPAASVRKPVPALAAEGDDLVECLEEQDMKKITPMRERDVGTGGRLSRTSSSESLASLIGVEAGRVRSKVDTLEGLGRGRDKEYVKVESGIPKCQQGLDRPGKEAKLEGKEESDEDVPEIVVPTSFVE